MHHLTRGLRSANGNQTGWDEYNRLWEPLMATIPNLMSPGNHDGPFRYGNNFVAPYAQVRSMVADGAVL